MTNGIQGWESDLERGKVGMVFMSLVRVRHTHRHVHIDRQTNRCKHTACRAARESNKGHQEEKG